MNFGELRVLSDISFTIKENEFASIIGPSGCGKTTLLYLIQGLIKQTSGEIISVGKKGFVFQDHNLFPWKTIKENILIGPNEQSNIDLILEKIDLERFSDFYPSQVSEGMKQRAGIGRCLAYNSEILLMDEPFCSLDYFTKIKVQEFLLTLWKERKLTILFVTHDIEEAIRLSTKIVVLCKSPTRVIEIIDVDKNKSDAIRKEILDLIQKSSDSTK
ncbi:ATP-binding cassette domain-containing protein [Candidatus Woesearchaeota archaeon]|nr:ATP-binding cassette domain-containing protein [Candidatus Woesearchaeota archaeon]